MANYLERVASSAGRRAAIAKPPTSGPPVLPAGRDFSNAPADPFASDEEQFVESLETLAPARTEKHAAIPSAPKDTEESTTKVRRDARERLLAIREVDVDGTCRIAFDRKPFGEIGQLARAHRARNQAAGLGQ